MKILFTRFPLESAHGGAEIQTLALMRGLRERGHAVAFLGSCPVLLAECRAEGFPVAELSIGPPPVTTWSALSFLWRKQTMQRKLVDALAAFHDLDTICMLGLSEKLLLTKEAHAKGIRVLWIEHDRIGPWLTKNPWLPRLREQSRHALTIGVSELSAGRYRALGWPADRVVAIPNGIDLSRLRDSPQRAMSNEQRVNGLHVGSLSRLSEEKGIDLLVAAALDLPEISLTIVGKGREEGYLRTLAEPARDRIRIIPHVHDLGEFYRSLDCFVLPSRDHDPFGLSAAEAMASGIPVIVTDQCGIAGSLTNGKDALIVKANSSQALKEALQSMLDPSTRSRFALASKATAERSFSLENMINAYERMLCT